MNDATARELLAGIDGPRSLPAELDGRLVALLADAGLGLSDIDSPRPLPDDLRHRLEATLLTAAAKPVPQGVQRKVLALTRRPPPLLIRVAAVAAAVLGLIGVVTAVRPVGDGTDVATGGPPATVRSTTTTSNTTTSPPTTGGTTSGGSSGTAAGGGAGTEGVPFGGSGATAGTAGSGAAPTASADATRGEIRISAVGSGTDVAAGFEAYLRTLNRAGGIGGRAVVTGNGTSTRVATVNLGESPLADRPDGVVFETAFVDGGHLGGPVLSLASPVERQARLAVAHAFPDAAPDARAAVYAGATEPWATIVPTAIEVALRDRGVTPVRVPFTAEAPAFFPTDAAFLSLSPTDVSAWVAAAPVASATTTWAVGSGWDDRLAPRAAQLSLTVLSPYAPVGGDEQAALTRELGADRRLTAAAVHGWVTAKAIAVLLAMNDAGALTEADLDHLGAWNPGWAPPYEVRPGTRERVPDAVVLRPAGPAFSRVGDFERDAT